MPSRINISIPLPSSDGKYHGRYPAGNAPGAQLVGAASSVTSAVGAILTGIALAAGATDATSAAAALSTGGGGATFDYYVSPTGSDTNAGTVASPWAITSLMMSTQNAHNVANFALTRSNRVGFLPGTYNISTYMGTDSFTGAFQIDGGTSGSPTYYGSCNSSGFYQVGTATITALSSGGLPGGGLAYPDNGPILGGLTNTPHTEGYVTIDGLNFTEFTFKAIRLGGLSASDGPAITGDVLIQNCSFYGQNFVGISGGNSNDNEACIWLDGTATTAAGGTGNYVITNNYFYNNAGGAGNGDQHLCSIFLFNCALVQITYNSCINAGSFAWGKDSANQGTTCAYNYVDNTATFTGSGGAAVYGFSDFTGAYNGTTGLTLTSNFYGNVILTNGWGFGLRGAAVNEAWQTPVNIYNNTVVGVSGGDLYPMIWANTTTGNEGKVKIYNNILTGVADASGYKHLITSGLALSLCDYNGEPSTAMSWALLPVGAGNTVSATYSSVSTFAAAVVAAAGVSGCESHSVANNTPSFTNSGTLAQLYQLQSGSPFKGVGSTTGLSGGAACDMGAWGGVSPPTQIGCSFA